MVQPSCSLGNGSWLQTVMIVANGDDEVSAGLLGARGMASRLGATGSASGLGGVCWLCAARPAVQTVQVTGASWACVARLSQRQAAHDVRPSASYAHFTADSGFGLSVRSLVTYTVAQSPPPGRQRHSAPEIVCQFSGMATLADSHS